MHVDHVNLLTDQLSRLHMILKPFMLRRVKKDVENELSDKVCIVNFPLKFFCKVSRASVYSFNVLMLFVG